VVCLRGIINRVLTIASSLRAWASGKTDINSFMHAGIEALLGVAPFIQGWGTHLSQYVASSFESVREDDIANVTQEEEWADLEFAPLMYKPKGRPSVQRVKGILERRKQGGRGARGTQVCEDCWYGGHEMRNPICPKYDVRMLADARQAEEQPPPPPPDPQ